MSRTLQNSEFRARLTGLTLAFLLIINVGCKSPEQIEFERGEAAAAKNNNEVALKHFKAVVDRFVKTPLAIKAAKEAARITHYQLKRPKEALDHYKHVVLNSADPAERLAAQKKLADLYFTQILDYQQAITEYSRLLELPRSQSEDFAYRLAIARSYFYLQNFYQAQVEIDAILGRPYDRNMLFDALLLKANIFLTSKNHDEAILALRKLMDDYPKRSKTETIGLILAVTYEEQKNFPKAIETLQAIRDIYPRKEFIEARIKTLRERQSYLPGARGLKK